MQKIVLILLVLFLSFNGCFAAKKKAKQTPPKMVETKQDWEQEAKNIPLEQRKLEDYKEPESTKKFYYPKPKYVFEKYNSSPGKREINIDNIKKDLKVSPYIVTDINCKYAAYPRYYYSPENNQISSEFFVGKLDTSQTKVKRILNYHHNQKERTPIVEAGTKELYPNLFRGLTLVDWSRDSKKILIKEKIGSLQEGIYKTHLYLYVAGDDIEEGYTYKLNWLDEAIKKYYLDYENIQLVKYRYNIEPLGFSADDDDLIIALAFAYDKDNKKIFLGTWGYDYKNTQIRLLSKTRSDFEVSVNGMFIKESLE